MAAPAPNRNPEIKYTQVSDNLVKRLKYTPGRAYPIRDYRSQAHSCKNGPRKMWLPKEGARVSFLLDPLLYRDYT